MDWIEQKFIGIISVRLRNFHKKSSTLYNFSCPFCGDSTKDKSKARGYLYVGKKSTTLYSCKNCGYGCQFNNFLKTFDEQLYNQYSLEKYTNIKTPKKEEFTVLMDKPKFNNNPLNKLKRISQLDDNDIHKKWIVDRKIPIEQYDNLYYCPNFFGWTNTIIPNKFSDYSVKNDEERIIIPFFNRENTLHAFQGRTIDKHLKLKYITIVVDDTIPKIYGLNIVDFTKITYVFEGPFDSQFIPNSIAIAGGDMVSTLIPYDKSNMVIVYDNERRSPETTNKIKKSIINGYSVVVWPDEIKEKDINDMILSGYSQHYIKQIIDNNTYKGLSATAALSRWNRT